MKLSLINEGYGRTHSMDGGYMGFNVDPTPNVLSLGRWRHPNTGNLLLAGLNLHYLSDEQVINLQTNLHKILQDRNLQRRVRAIRAIIPDVFNDAYRTYDTQKIAGQVTKGTLKFISPSKFMERVKQDGPIDTKVGFKQQLPTDQIPGKISSKIKDRHERMRTGSTEIDKLGDLDKKLKKAGVSPEKIDDEDIDTIKDAENIKVDDKDKDVKKGPMDDIEVEDENMEDDELPE